MRASYWKKRWKNNDIDFHQSKTNVLLTKYIQQLNLNHGDRIFLPLCGKTLDIGWLLSEGYQVAGSELSEKGVQQLFEELEIKPDVSKSGELKLYQASNIAILVGDFFNISSDHLGPVDAVYDRAALVALPKAMRKRYTAHLTTITNSAPQLLFCYEYDQKQMKGPPFSVSGEELKQHYQYHYDLNLISSRDVPDGLKGKCSAKENTWLLKPHQRSLLSDTKNR